MPSEKSKEEGFLAKTLRIISEELPQFVQSQAIPFTGKKDGKESVMNTDMVAEERAVLEGILKAGLLVAPGAGAAAKVAQQFPRATGRLPLLALL